MKNFFQREPGKDYNTKYLSYIKDKVNVANLFSLTKKQILNFYHFGQAQNFLAYRFAILKQWMKENERYVKTYPDELDEVIDKLCLRNELNSFEKQYIINVNAIVFAKVRNLKQLIVDFSIRPKELVFYRYEINEFNEIKNGQNKEVLTLCDFYITTERLIVSKQIDIISIDYAQINNYEVKRNRIVFNLKNNRRYSIVCHNALVIYVSLERVLKRQKIYLNK